MDWLLLALLTPLLWSVVVLIDDNLVRSVYKSPYTGAIISGLFGLLPLISLSWGHLTAISLSYAVFAILSGALAIGYYFFYFMALQKESPSVVIALFSLTPATLPFLAHYLLGEMLSPQQIAGFCVVLLFTFLLAVVDIRKFSFTKALFPVIAAVVLMDFSVIAGKHVYQHNDFYTGFMYYSLGMGVAAVILFLWARFRTGYNLRKELVSSHRLRTLGAFIVLTEIINIAAEFTSNLAISKGPVSLVEVIQNTQPMYILLIALLLYPFFPAYFREAGQGRIPYKFVMLVGILCGVALTIASSL